MTHSFDIFDTCLIRSCGRSVYVFDILADKILGPEACTTLKNEFAYIRKQGEACARTKFIEGEIEEITLDQIYECCDFSSITDVSIDAIKLAELEVEEEVLVPVYEIKKEIDNLHKNGEDVFFISDMYLPQDFIKKTLEKHGFLKSGDSLYLSSTYKKTKDSGNLFKIAKEDKHLSYHNWIHKGDNKHSDYKVPKKLGIKSHLINHEYTTYEKQLAGFECGNGKLNRHVIASISRAIRLSNESSPAHSFACDFIAPIYVPFVYSIMSDAQKRGIKDMFFLARDGYIFYKIAEGIKNTFKDIEIHYIYVSRKSLYLPSLDKIDLDSLDSRLAFIDDYTIEDICERFQLNDELEEFNQYKTIKGKDLLKQLLEDENFVKCLNDKRDQQRQLCIDYFIQEGLTNPHSAVIDLTGSRKCHLAINKILKSRGYPSVFAYYFDVLSHHIVGNDYYALLFQDRKEYNRSIAKDPQAIFEQYFSITDQCSTAGYIKRHNKVFPLFESPQVDMAYCQKTLNTNLAVCYEFCKKYIELVDTRHSEEYACEALKVFTSFAIAPEYYYLKALEGLVVGVSSIRVDSVLKKSNIIKVLLTKTTIWREADIVYNFPIKSLATVLLQCAHYIRNRVR